MTDSSKVLATILVSPIVCGFVAGILAVIGLGKSIGAGWLVLFLMVFGLLYGLMAGLLRSYDLSAHTGVLTLLVVLTWSLPNTVAGFLLGNLIYIFFGNPSRELSESRSWIAYKARGTSGFGVDVLQTIGTVNLGGAGNHEPIHVLQARIFGPLFIPIVIMNYILTGTLQVLFTITLGAILKAAGKRDTPYFRPPEHSAVSGFFGWIYYATIFELWAYATES